MELLKSFNKLLSLSLWHSESSDTVFLSKATAGDHAHLATVLQQVQDRSSCSAELQASLLDHACERYFSPQSSNLLRPIRFEKKHQILELGCHYGAMSRYLGEVCDSIVSIDPDPERAYTAAWRCLDLPHVTVISAPFEGLNIDHLFDFVVVVDPFLGQINSDKIKPYKELFQQAKRYLKPEGSLVLAVDNPFGIKYFGGCSEDHSGAYFGSLEGMLHEKIPNTLSKPLLEKTLEGEGFSTYQFLGVFPDIRFPDVLLNHDAAQKDSIPLAPWLGFGIFRDYYHNRIQTFQESLVAQHLEQQGLLANFANGFLVMATPNTQKVELFDSSVLAYKYNNTRAKPFMTAIHLKRDLQGNRVDRSYLWPNEPQPQQGVVRHQLTWEEPFVVGSNFMELCIQSLRSELDLEKTVFFHRVQQWIEFLKNKGRTHLNDETLVPVNYLDCLPWNLILTKEGSLVYIDQEWHSIHPLPVSFIIVRGLIHLYRKLTPLIFEEIPEFIDDPSASGFVNIVLKRLGIPLSSEELDGFWIQEWDFQRSIQLKEGLPFDDFKKFLNQGITAESWRKSYREIQTTQSFNHQIQILQHQIETQQQHIETQQNSLSELHQQLYASLQVAEQQKHVIHAMETSIFWRIRDVWVKVRALRGKDDPFEEIRKK